MNFFHLARKGRIFQKSKLKEQATSSNSQLECISDSSHDDEISSLLSLTSDDEEDCEEPEENFNVEKESDSQSQSSTHEYLSFELPTEEELLEEKYNRPDDDKLAERIQRVSALLSNRKEELSAPQNYVAQLVSDLSLFYECDKYFVEEIMKMFDVDEALAYFGCEEKQSPKCIYVNTLKTKRVVLQRAFESNKVTKLKWCKVGLLVYDEPNFYKRMIEYRDGHFTVERACNFLPVMALDPQEHETIAEMFASEGGITMQIAARMRNTGTIFANVVEKFTDTFYKNLELTGVTNTTVYTNPVLKDACVGVLKVDRVLLLAPSSNSGLIGPFTQKKLSKKDIKRRSRVQKQLLLGAIDMVDADSGSGGYIVYATRSVMIEENEAVVDYALKRRDVEIVLTEPRGHVGFTSHKNVEFHPSLGMTTRFHPHVNNIGGGMFVAKLKKVSSKQAGEDSM